MEVICGALYDYYNPDVVSATDYYPGGMPMNGRYINGDKTPNGYNGQRRDDEVYGTGNLNSAMFWEYDTRLNRRWNMDPKPAVGQSLYATFGNNPVYNVDVLGDKEFHYNAVKDSRGNTTLQLTDVKTVYKNVIVGYAYNAHAPSGRYPIYKTVEDTKNRYIVATKNYVYTDNGTGNRRVDYTTESSYDSYEEAYANRDNPNDLKGPLLVGLANVAHAHRQGETWGIFGYRANSRVYRTQGGEIPNASRERVSINESGNINIGGDEMLYITLNDKSHQIYFYQKRGGAAKNAEIVSFEIPRSLADEIIKNAVPQAQGKAYPNNPQISDPSKSGSAYGLPKAYIEKLRQQAISWSGKTEQP